MDNDDRTVPFDGVSVSLVPFRILIFSEYNLTLGGRSFLIRRYGFTSRLCLSLRLRLSLGRLRFRLRLVRFGGKIQIRQGFLPIGEELWERIHKGVVDLDRRLGIVVDVLGVLDRVLISRV